MKSTSWMTSSPLTVIMALALGASACGESSQARLSGGAGEPTEDLSLGDEAPSSEDAEIACDWDSSCPQGRVCLGTCVPASSTPGAHAGPCRTQGPACEEGLECRAGTCADPEQLAQAYEKLTVPPEAIVSFDGETRQQELEGEPEGSPEASLEPLPEAVSLKAWMPPVGKQAHGDCVPWTVGYGLKSFQEARERGWSFTPEHLMSPAYLFNQVAIGSCSGSQMGPNLGKLQYEGIASLATMPYDSSEGACVEPPSAQAREEAQQYKIESWEEILRVYDDPAPGQYLMTEEQLDRIKRDLAQGHPVPISLHTTRKFMRLGAAPLRDYDEQNGGIHAAHAVLLAGYDDRNETLLFLNSWGTSWGNEGYGRMSYDMARQLIFGAWSVRDVQEQTPAPIEPGPPEPVSSELSIELSWDAAADLDLSVREPGEDGEELSYRNNESAMGGVLENDQGCRIYGEDSCQGGGFSERVVWVGETLPTGEFTATVKHHEGAEQVRATLALVRDGQILEEHELNLAEEDARDTIVFTVGGTDAPEEPEEPEAPSPEPSPELPEQPEQPEQPMENPEEQESFEPSAPDAGPDPDADGSGCSAAGGGSPAGQGALLLLGGAWLALGRRRRR